MLSPTARSAVKTMRATLVGGPEGDRVWFRVGGCAEADYVDPQPASVGGTASPIISHERHRAQLADIIAAIRAGKPSPVSGEEGLKALKIILGIYESSATGRWVDVA